MPKKIHCLKLELDNSQLLSPIRTNKSKLQEYDTICDRIEEWLNKRGTLIIQDTWDTWDDSGYSKPGYYHYGLTYFIPPAIVSIDRDKIVNATSRVVGQESGGYNIISRGPNNVGRDDLEYRILICSPLLKYAKRMACAIKRLDINGRIIDNSLESQ